MYNQYPWMERNLGVETDLLHDRESGNSQPESCIGNDFGTDFDEGPHYALFPSLSTHYQTDTESSCKAGKGIIINYAQETTTGIYGSVGDGRPKGNQTACSCNWDLFEESTNSAYSEQFRFRYYNCDATLIRLHENHCISNNTNENQQTEVEIGGKKGSNSERARVWRCDLCDVTCSGKIAFDKHELGKKHKKAEAKAARYALDMALGIQHNGHGQEFVQRDSNLQLPSYNYSIASGITESEYTKVNVDDSVSKSSGSSSNSSDTEATQSTVSFGDRNMGQLLGQEYIEETKNTEGKIISRYCTLCDCQLYFPKQLENHMKGRRHQSLYKERIRFNDEAWCRGTQFST